MFAKKKGSINIIDENEQPELNRSIFENASARGNPT
jgi:hypothetical protein